MHEVKSEREVTQSYPTLRDPMDCSLPGSSIHGIFQARVLEWGAIKFSMLSKCVFYVCYTSDLHLLLGLPFAIHFREGFYLTSY